MTTTQYSFQNINIEELVQKSFNEFLEENQIKYPYLSNKLMKKWNFEEYLSKNNILPLDLEKEPTLIDLIPNISYNKSNNNNNNDELRLVKFFGTIQNILENQIYINAKYDINNKNYLVYQYFESNSKITNLTDDIFVNESGKDILGDRLGLELIPVEGLNDYFGEKYNLDKNKQNIIVYDYSNKYNKINKNILVIGVAYEKNDIIVIHSWKILDNYEKIKICKDYNLYPNIKDKKNIYREKLKQLLLKTLKFDKLASDYLLLFLFCQTFSKIGTKNVGAFPLNLIIDKNNDINKCNDIFSNILSIFHKICLKMKSIKLTTDELNNNLYYPKFDVEIEQLYPGQLQLSDGTFLLVDEINMNEGKLIENGIKNIGAIKSLVDFQLLAYEYPYNKIEINHDIEILIITHKTKSIISSPFLTLLPIITNNDTTNDVEVLDDNDFKFIFYYLNYIRYDSSFKGSFTINDKILKTIKKNFRANNKNFKRDDFDLILTLSRLHALSYGRNYLTYEDYQYVLSLEKQRKRRLDDYNKNKAK